MSEAFPITGTRKEMEQWLRDRAQEDADFRDRLLRDPRATAAAIVGHPIPEEIELNVIDPEPGKTYVLHRIDGTPLSSTDSDDDGDRIAAIVHRESFDHPAIWYDVMTNCKATLELIGVSVPDDVNVEVLTETPTRFFLVLSPPFAQKRAPWVPASAF